MNLNYPVIFKALCALILIMCGAMCIPLIISMYYGENDSTLAFTLTVVPISIIIGAFYFLIPRNKPDLTIRDGFFIVTFSWIIAAFIGALPFYLSGYFESFADAFFEATSGLTTTGNSTLNNVEVLPKGILFWRCLMHWIGGMGILIFTIAVLPSLGKGANIIASLEAPGPTMDKITPKMSDTARNLYKMYAVLTLTLFIILKLLGLSVFDASTTALATVSTGGFANYNASVAHFQSLPIELILVVFMVVSGVNFNLYFYAVRSKQGLIRLFKDEELRLYLGIIFIVSMLIGLNLCLSDVYTSLGRSMRYAFFQVASIITTTGFSTANFDIWPTFSKMLIFMLMFLGGCSSSTSGGIKVVRILIVLKLIKRTIQMRLHPNAIINIKINEKTASIDTVSSVTTMLFLHMLLVFISTLLVCLDGFDFLTSFSSVLTCIGNIGPGFNLVGPAMNFSLFSAPVKYLLSALMIAGRLELYAFVIMFLPHFWLQDRS